MKNRMLAEINEIPERALYFIKESQSFSLPSGVPYLGMGSSWFAPLAFKYMGINIMPEIASEYFNYITSGDKLGMAVILSQSGKSREVLWCRDLFEKYISITNNTSAELSRHKNMIQTIDIMAGDEQNSSSKTYINTLLALFKGFGFDMQNPLQVMVDKMSEYERKGISMAKEVYDAISDRKIHGIYIIGSGPNIATAFEAALILSESTKLCFNGMSMAQYDHGPKETAFDSIVIQIMAKGRSYERAQKLTELIVSSGAYVITVEEPEVEERFSVLHNIIPFNYMAYYLAEKLGITDTFLVGRKITEV